MLVHQLGFHAEMQPVMLNKVGLHFTRCLNKIFIVISVPTKCKRAAHKDFDNMQARTMLSDDTST